MLLANIGVLTSSSFLCTSTHIYRSVLCLTITLVLGLIFVINQADETFSVFNVMLNSDISSMIFILYIHLSHLILCSIILSLTLFFGYIVTSDTTLSIFGLAY